MNRRNPLAFFLVLVVLLSFMASTNSQAINIDVQDFYIDVDVQDFYINVDVQDFYRETGIIVTPEALRKLGKGETLQSKVDVVEKAKEVFQAEVHRGDPVYVQNLKTNVYILIHKKSGKGVKAITH